MARKSGTGRELTLTERARQAQLIDATVDLVAERGYPGTSLAAIADHAGITKAAVLYHFPNKAALVRAAYAHVLGALVQHVAAAVEEAGRARGPEAYIRGMVGHLRRHPRHTRMIIEAITSEDGEPDQDQVTRWQTLAGILAEARDANGLPPADQRTVALVIGGAIDSIVAEQLRDPAFEAVVAVEELIDLVAPAWRG